MLRSVFKRGWTFAYNASRCSRYMSSTSSKPSSDPLRILFCGSDQFSCESLRQLYKEHLENKDLVESIEVMVLLAKPTGRSFKTIRNVPCKILADELGLPTHQRQTFTGWDIPTSTNLIVAVSFGLFVPPRILKSAKYGGLNVHPSFLPDLRGPAPLHHAVIRGDKHIGISLQTLDHKVFDNGTVLAQTERPGIPIPPGATVPQLTQLVAPFGARMLVQGLRDGLHVPPRKAVVDNAVHSAVAHAPKVTKADEHVDWKEWTSGEIVRRIRALGSLWTQSIDKNGRLTRLIIQDAEEYEWSGPKPAIQQAHLVRPWKEGDGDFKVCRAVVQMSDNSVVIEAANSSWVRLKLIKKEGKPKASNAAAALRSAIHE